MAKRGGEGEGGKRKPQISRFDESKRRILDIFNVVVGRVSLTKRNGNVSRDTRSVHSSNFTLTLTLSKDESRLLVTIVEMTRNVAQRWRNHVKIDRSRCTVWSLERCRLVCYPDRSLRTILRARNSREKDGGSSTRATLSTRIRINDDTRFTSIRRGTSTAPC